MYLHSWPTISVQLKRSFASDGTASASRGARADASNKDDPRENDISRKTQAREKSSKPLTILENCLSAM